MLIMDIKLVTCTISLAPRKSISECIFTNIIIMQYTTSILYANGKVTARALCSRLGLFSKENCTHPTNLQMYNVGRRRCRKTSFILLIKNDWFCLFSHQKLHRRLCSKSQNNYVIYCRKWLCLLCF